MTSSENDFHATITNNGCLHTPNNLLQNNKKNNTKYSDMDEVTGALLSDNDANNSNTKIEIKKNINNTSPQAMRRTPSPTNAVSATKTSFVHFGPGHVTTSSIEPNCIYKEAKIRNRFIIFFIGSTILGIAIGILLAHMVKYQTCSTGDNY